MRALSISAMIMASGSGARFGSDIPKQYVSIAGKPILIHTIEKFLTVFAIEDLIVVVHPDHKEQYIVPLMGAYPILQKIKIVNGGDTRSQSVCNGLEQLSSSHVMIHDAVRMMISSALILNLKENAIQSDALIPVMAVEDSLRKKNEDRTLAVDRDQYMIVQTPQCFDTAALKSAFEKRKKYESDNDVELSFTDEASLMEWIGMNVTCIAGEKNNFKITTPEDADRAAFLLSLK